MLAIYIVARIKGLPSLPFPGIRKLSISTAKALGGLMLIVIVLGSIYGGVASPRKPRQSPVSMPISLPSSAIAISGH